MQYVMVASAGQSDIIMQHAAGREICQILMSRMEETGAPAAAGKDKNRPKKSCSVFYFLPFVFVFVGSRFRIYENVKGVFPFVFARSCFYPELTRIYSVFHPVFNLCEICLEIDMLINLLISQIMHVNMITHGILVNIGPIIS